MKWLALGLVALVSSVSGCASARYVQKNQDNGVVAIPENSNVWPTHYEDAAKALIKQHVGPNFEIVESYEVTVGPNGAPVGPNQRYGTTDPANPMMATGASTKTEYRIAYRKKLIPPGGMPIGAMNAPFGATRPPLSGAGMGAGGMVPAGAYVPNGSLTGTGSMSPTGIPGSGMPPAGQPYSGLATPNNSMSGVPSNNMSGMPGGMGVNNPSPSVAPVTPANYNPYNYSAPAPSAQPYVNAPYGR